MFGKSAENVIRIETHEASVNSDALNRSTERATREAAFLETAIALLHGLNFPAYRQQILDHVKAASPNSECIGLYQMLDHYIQYDDAEQIRAAFEVNLPHSKHHATPWRRDDISVIKTTPAT